MRFASRIVTPAIRSALSLICRVDAKELDKIPREGPWIIVTNHVNFLEVPLIYAYLYPRDSSSMIKRETWKNPALAFLAWCWSAIPLQRHALDRDAMRCAEQTIVDRRFLLIAPEGTRSVHGRLQKGHGGVVQLALRSGAPIIPLAHTGGEKVWQNLKRFRRTDFRFFVGRPFRLVPPTDERGTNGALTRALRQDLADAVMNRIAILLPPWQHGAYPEPEKASVRNLEFI